jgi:hypothetical protein
MRFTARTFPALAAMVLSFMAAACGNDDNGAAVGPGQTRVFNQVERLGNPLVSEVFLAKRDHGFHNAGMPSTDVANFAASLKGFVATVAGRDATVQNTLAVVLLPDMLIVQTDKPANTAGWLNWVGVAPLANGFGGRKLTDDVVDLALLAVFGDPFGLDPAGAQGKEALTTDNVAFDSPGITTTFPYLAPPN